jgi:hypothetical protein
VISSIKPWALSSAEGRLRNAGSDRVGSCRTEDEYAMVATKVVCVVALIASALSIVYRLRERRLRVYNEAPCFRPGLRDYSK